MGKRMLLGNRHAQPLDYIDDFMHAPASPTHTSKPVRLYTEIYVLSGCQLLLSKAV